MAQYTLLEPSYIPRRPGEPAQLLPAGTIIEYDGTPSANLAPGAVVLPAEDPLTQASRAAGRLVDKF